jgi:hypothetical protein
MNRTVSRAIRPLCGVFVVGLLAAFALAQQAATDGLVWDKGNPKYGGAVGTGKYYINVSGGLDTTKYKDIKISSDEAFMETVALDKDGKEVAGTKNIFKVNVYKDKGKWDGNSLKRIVNGKEENFDGFGPGKYKVTVEVKVKETATSDSRSAKITDTLTITDGPPPTEDGSEDRDSVSVLWRPSRQPRGDAARCPPGAG